MPTEPPKFPIEFIRSMEWRFIQDAMGHPGTMRGLGPYELVIRDGQYVHHHAYVRVSIFPNSHHDESCGPYGATAPGDAENSSSPYHRRGVAHQHAAVFLYDVGKGKPVFQPDDWAGASASGHAGSAYQPHRRYYNRYVIPWLPGGPVISVRRNLMK